MNLSLLPEKNAKYEKKKQHLKVDPIEITTRLSSRRNCVITTGMNFTILMMWMKPGIMLDIVEESIEFFCPTKEIKIKKLKEKWVTQELLEFINDKDDLLRLAKRTNNIDDWNTARIARNLVAGMVRNAKKDFLQEEINQNYEKPQQILEGYFEITSRFQIKHSYCAQRSYQ